MPSRPFLRISRSSRSGVALVIVLAFVLLLTGLVVAFFSRALSERQISNSSANQVKVDVLARGAVSTVIGDLQQEIAAGSSAVLPSPAPAQGGGTIFVPGIKTTAGVPPPNAATMVPALVLPSPTPASGTLGLENLIKQSVGGQPFYANLTPGSSYLNYDVGNFPPSTRAAKSVTGTGASGDNSTARASLSGRYISSARWNKPLLMPATSATDLTPVITGGTYVPPDWVLVARDGSNPSTWNANLTTSATSTAAVTGRFAYNLYDEGGLLDANVAGYPGTAAGTTASTASAGQYGYYKNALAYADLTQLTDATGTQLLSQAQIDALVGWRNSASANVPGAFPSPAFTDSSRTSYYSSMLLNSTGFLRIGNAPLSNTKQSDRMFSGRQTLIDLMQSIVALQSSDPTKPDLVQLAKANASLRYFGTFGRGLSQPSFIRRQAVDPTITLSYDATVPHLLNTTAGGNNAAPDNNGGTPLDAAINPSFLNVRVKTTTSKGRYDGSDLVAGELLVKKRFSLNRLAWLTYKGPSAQNMTDPVVVATIQALAGTTNPGDAAYQSALQFVQQGTVDNIINYFGLSWGSDPKSMQGTQCWLYNKHNRGGTTGPICKLSYGLDTTDVVRANREADFFELLKASVNVGSLAKVGTVAKTDPNARYLVPSYQTQYDDDSRVDDAIIQMGANIIDQFDLDGYPTCINFNDGGTLNGKDFHGVENLPYLSRLAHALVKVKQPDTTPDPTTAGAIQDTGVGALLQCPVIWNPHDYNSANVTQTFGVAYPNKFRVYADSSAYAVNNAVTLYGIFRDPASGQNLGQNHYQGADTGKSKSWNTKYGFNFSATGPLEPRSLSLSNTELDFAVNGDVTRFREPTVLCLSTASGGYVDTSPSRSSNGTIGNTAAFFSSDGGFKSDVSSGLTGIPPVRGQGYVGFYLGAVPLYWSDASVNSPPHPFYYTDELAVVSPVSVDYHLQYQDANGKWVDYDVKSRSMGGGGPYAESSTISAGGDRSIAANGWMSFFYPNYGIPGATPPSVSNTNHYNCSFAAMDPRTSRFGLMKLTGGKQDAPYWTYPPYGAYSTTMATRTANANTVGFSNGWINASAGVILGLRSGTSDGTPFMCPLGVFPTSMGWNPGSVTVAMGGRYVACNNESGANPVLGQTTGNHVCRPGLFSQNNPFARRDNLAMGDDGDSAANSAFIPPNSSNAAQFYTDADGVVRRATGGLVPFASSGPVASTDVGLPTTVANQAGTARLDQSNSRPMILNRPFRTVGELGYTFSGTPWKNINFDMPESGDTALLDVFCVNDTDDANGLVAGKVNLNTRQAPVIQAIIAGAYKDERNPGTAGISGTLPALIAKGLVARTTSTATGKGPLQNVSELVGKWVADAGTAGTSGGASSPIFNPKSYDGFSADLIDNTKTPAGGILVAASDTNSTISRYADATLRALSSSGQTRVWNLMIDVIAQTGRYPQSATTLDKFAVEGEQRFWVHVAIDRLTGQVIDKQIELVKE